MSTETIALGAPEENVRKSIKHAMMHEMLGKNTTDAVYDSTGAEIIPANTPLTEEYIEAVLNSDAKEVKVRNNNIRGIEVEAIKEGNGIIESLEDRIVGRVLAEDIIDPATGEKSLPLTKLLHQLLLKQFVKYVKKFLFVAYSHVNLSLVYVLNVMVKTLLQLIRLKLVKQLVSSLLNLSVNLVHSLQCVHSTPVGLPVTKISHRVFHVLKNCSKQENQNIMLSLLKSKVLFSFPKIKKCA